MFLHSPIFLQDCHLVLPHKTCFEGLCATIHHGAKIALMGPNGCGKSSLLKFIAGLASPVEGVITHPEDVQIAYVPQLIHTQGSGGERFNGALTEALALNPDLLLLDEPTNHLDDRNRRSLMGLLNRFSGTLVVATHDVALLRDVATVLWPMDQSPMAAYAGGYEAYWQAQDHERERIEQSLSQLSQEKREAHQALMREQSRAQKSRQMGEKHIQQRKWPTVVSAGKARRAEETSGRKKTNIQKKREHLLEQIDALHLPEVICPTFHLSPGGHGPATPVHIRDGWVAYGQERILSAIHVSVGEGERVGITGDNGSGKTTLIKGILEDPHVTRGGEWFVPKAAHVGHLDQHYQILGSGSVMDALAKRVPEWSHAQLRAHLNDFLFRKNEEVNASVDTLSGGEKARACLALIAACPPHLLILDEVTNNLDLAARAHVIQILKTYPGTMLLISHDPDFLEAVGVNRWFAV